MRLLIILALSTLSAAVQLQNIVWFRFDIHHIAYTKQGAMPQLICTGGNAFEHALSLDTVYCEQTEQFMFDCEIIHEDDFTIQNPQVSCDTDDNGNLIEWSCVLRFELNHVITKSEL